MGITVGALPVVLPVRVQAQGDRIVFVAAVGTTLDGGLNAGSAERRRARPAHDAEYVACVLRRHVGERAAIRKGSVRLITKRPVDGSSGVEVTFTLPADAAPVSVAGDFNDWDEHVTPLQRSGETCSATVTVDGGRCYGFRYVDGEGRWFNDETADSYEPNSFGGHNGVVDLTGAP